MKKILLFLLVAVFALTLLTACSSENKETYTPSTGADANIVLPEAPKKENEILGKDGNVKFSLLVTYKNDARVMFNVETTKDNLGDALVEGSIIKCDGKTITRFDGEKVEAGDISFYKDGEIIEGDIFSTPIAEGDTFEAVKK